MTPEDSFRLIDMRSPKFSRVQSLRQQVGRSALALALWRRFGLIQNQASNEKSFVQRDLVQRDLEQGDPQLALDAARVPRITVRGLKKAYGPRLLIVYSPAFFGTRYDSVEPPEREILALCVQEGVACLSVRDALAQERYEQFRLSRGFHNTAPGAGHFNATGHRIIGQQIWRYISGWSWPPTPVVWHFSQLRS